MTCARCQGSFPPQQIDFIANDAVCVPCIRKADSDPAELARAERAFRRSVGRRQIAVGLVMVVLGGVILAFTASAGSVVVLPTGMLFGGLYELARGASNLS